MKKFLRNNGLSLALAALFLIFWGAQAVAGFKVHNQDAALHSQPQVTFGEYLKSGHFWQATGENWESEFLQMGAYVLMTAYLFQKDRLSRMTPMNRNLSRHPGRSASTAGSTATHCALPF